MLYGQFNPCINHASWTIITLTYNFQTSFIQCQYNSTHILTFIQHNSMISPYTGCIKRLQRTTNRPYNRPQTRLLLCLKHDSKRPYNQSKSQLTHGPQRQPHTGHSKATKPVIEQSQISPEISTKSALKTSPKIWTQTEKQTKLQ